ncbi:leucine-rich repeat extensin-like protein 3 [Zingiber officinale]|uniref:leucine-rich repeat extensin-like protein 3 n=1 Tax=Zingiber officinale TaxID=94328 RepID=UPI001C4BC620|nr:leucine-rich repeat extensin-like protein 3 [Zingiber officinale]
MAPLEVPTSATPAVSTPIVFTVPPGVPLAYPAPAPAEPTTYSTPPPPGPIVYPTLAAPVPPIPIVYPAAPVPAVPVAPYPVPLPTVYPTTATYADPAVPPVAYAPVYAAASGVPPPDVSGLLSRTGNNPPVTFPVSDVGPEITSPQPALWDSQFAIIANCLGTRAEIVR